ncbi:MAG: anaerobic sulfite reductase subunit AsrB [Eubacteriales bacterium]|nr:anaerobic sulfite reductase subunit AsrB [Eubacteriales bacterium]
MCECKNAYIPANGTLIEIVKHTPIEWTFRIETDSTDVKPGQFYEISLPKYGESPISVSGIEEGILDFTIRNVGKVTGEIFQWQIGQKIRLRGPYGNGFDIEQYTDRDIAVVVGGSALAPVRGIIEYAYVHPDRFRSFKLIAGFRSPDDVLFAADLKKWAEKLDVLVTVDAAPEGYQGPVGLVTKYIPELVINDLTRYSAIVVGPPMMMKFTVAEFLKRQVEKKDIWVSYERKMHCGIGKCGHCKMDDTYICIDGPVFNYEFAEHLAD